MQMLAEDGTGCQMIDLVPPATFLASWDAPKPVHNPLQGDQCCYSACRRLLLCSRGLQCMLGTLILVWPTSKCAGIYPSVSVKPLKNSSHVPEFDRPLDGEGR